MDAERFGRALGVGTRAAAKALLQAAEAAAAPDPKAAARTPPATGRVGPADRTQAVGSAGRSVARGVVQAQGVSRSVRRGGKRFGETVWGPAARAGGVLWFEVTGVFFGLFVLTAGAEVWKRRMDFRGAGEAREHVWFAVAMLLVFGWFTVSSFLKAKRRGRQI